MKIVALDFETADNGPDSACALAMVAIEDGTISGQISFLIRPPRDTFVYTYIHGITWAHVRHELIFAERIPEIEEFIRNASYLVAHNAPFDRKVLYNCYSVSGHNPPANPFSCTVRLARAAWQIRPTKLPDVCSHLGIALNHHDAQSDALACARIAIAAQEAGIPIEMGLVGPHTYKLLRTISESGPARRTPRAQNRREKSRLARELTNEQDVPINAPSTAQKKRYQKPEGPAPLRMHLLIGLTAFGLIILYLLFLS